MKASIYGTGRIGTEVMSALLTGRVSENIINNEASEVILYSPTNYKRVEGAYKDLEDACSLLGLISEWNFKPTGDVSDIRGSDIVFFCAGKSPTKEEYQQAEARGIDDRMFQASKNIEILNDFCKNIQSFCPKAVIFIVTNPVDAMTDLARQKLPNNQIYGLGCVLDTARFKRTIKELLAVKGYNVAIRDITAFVLGHHCATMFVHQKSLNIRHADPKLLDDELLAQALEKTRGRGLEITRTNEEAATKRNNNGAYIAPAMMVARVLIAFNTKTDMILPLNRRIEEKDGVGMVGKSAQLLSVINAGKVIPYYLEFSEDDLSALRHSVKIYEESKKAFFS